MELELAWAQDVRLLFLLPATREPGRHSLRPLFHMESCILRVDRHVATLPGSALATGPRAHHPAGGPSMVVSTHVPF